MKHHFPRLSAWGFSLVLLVVTSPVSANEPADSLERLFEDSPVISTAPLSFESFSRRQLQTVVSAAGGSELSELVEDDETGYYQADFGDLTVMLTIDFVGEALSLTSESRVRGRMNEQALKRTNRWNLQQGFPRGFIVESGAVDNSPTTTWMLSDDHKTGFDVPSPAIHAFVQDFVATAVVFRRYASGERDDLAGLNQLEATLQPHRITFDSPQGNYRVEFPSKPTRRVVQIGTPDAELPEPHWEFVDEKSELSFCAMHFDYPQEMVAQVGANSILEAIRRQTAIDYNATVTGIRRIEKAAVVGCEFSLRCERGVEIAKFRLFQIKNRLYRFSVHSPEGIDSERAAKFLTSFEAAPNSQQQ